MADLITHASVGYLLKTARPDPKHTAAFVAGNVLPDLLSRLPSLALRALDAATPLDVPLWAAYFWEPLHMPAGMLLSACALSLLFVAEVRRGVLANLLGGMALHLALDLLQDHLGVGYMLLFPLSSRTFELGWIGSEATVPLAPLFALLAGLRWYHLKRRSARPVPDPG